MPVRRKVRSGGTTGSLALRGVALVVLFAAAVVLVPVAPGAMAGTVIVALAVPVVVVVPWAMAVVVGAVAVIVAVVPAAIPPAARAIPVGVLDHRRLGWGRWRRWLGRRRRGRRRWRGRLDRRRRRRRRHHYRRRRGRRRWGRRRRLDRWRRRGWRRRRSGRSWARARPDRALRGAACSRTARPRAGRDERRAGRVGREGDAYGGLLARHVAVCPGPSNRKRSGANSRVISARGEGQGGRRRVVADDDERGKRDRSAKSRSYERGHRDDCNASAHTIPSICRCTLVVLSANSLRNLNCK